MSRLYVSGPMTGLPEHNFPAFRAATERLITAGFDAVDPSRHGADPAFSWEDYLRRDLADVLDCDGVALLPGWERSKGATLEVHVARSLNMPCRHLDAWLDQAVALEVEPPAPRLAPRTPEVIAWTTHNFPDDSRAEVVLGLAEETGELCRAVLKREQGIRGTAEQWAAEVRKEIGDVVIKAHHVAGVEGFDLDDAVAERWAEISRRDWKVDPVGHGLPEAQAAGVNA